MNSIIRSTKNYKMFEVHDMNRSVYPETESFKNLVASMKKHGFIDAIPLHCVSNGGGKLKIKGGHHRFLAAQEAGVPVKYVVSKDTASIYELERSGPGKWKMKGFFDSFCKQGLNDYVAVQDYVEETGIGLNNALSMFYGHSAGSGNFTKDGRFQTGQFTINSYEHPRVVGDIVLFLKSLGVDWADKDPMVKAISRVVWLEEFDVERFTKKADKHTHLFCKQRGVDAYLQLIETVYNHGSPAKKKVNIAFLAKEAAAERMNRQHIKKT